MNDEDFNQFDVNDLENRFARIEKENHRGYRMEFILSKSTAEEMVNEWFKANRGDPISAAACWDRYEYIIQEIIDAVKMYG